MPTPEHIRICYISEAGDIGGGEVSLLTLLEHLPDRISPALLTYGPGELVQRAEAMGIPTRVIPRGGPTAIPRVAGESAAWIRETGAALIHVNTLDIRAGLAARLAGRPLVGHLRVIMPFTWIDRWFVRMSDAVISVSESARDRLADGRDTISRKITVIPNTVASLGADRSLRSELQVEDKDILVGAIGRFDPVKGFEYLIDAIAELRTRHANVRLVLIGAPGDADDQKAYAENLRHAVEENGLSDAAAFTGFRPNAGALVAGLDVLVVPSTPRRTKKGIWEEGFGRVAVEGMSVGVPVIVSNSGGLPEIVEEDVTGKVVPPADSTALAQALEALIQDPALRKRLGDEGRRVFETRYTVERHLERVTRLYDRIASERVR